MINIMQTKMMPIWIWEADRGVGNTIVMLVPYMIFLLKFLVSLTRLWSSVVL